MSSSGFGVVLDDLSDFITPSQACVKPMQIDAKRSSALIELEDDDAAAHGRAQPAPAVAKVTLNDCLACSGCVTSAETVLITQQSADEFLSQLGGARPVVVSVSPATRASLAAHYGLSSVQVFERLAHALGRLGCRHVVDCGLAADISLIECAAEFQHRFVAAQARGRAGCLPVLSGSCPGWVCYAEKVHGEAVLPYMSTVKSPQQVMGTLVRALLDRSTPSSAAPPPSGGPPPVAPAARVYHVALMPCFDKKLEASRSDFADRADESRRDVDCVLSSAEVIELLASRGVDLGALDAIGSARGSGSVGLQMGGGGGGELTHAAARADGDERAVDELRLGNVDFGARSFRAPPGGSGGYCEYVFRRAAADLFGVDFAPGAELPWRAGRNADMRELVLEVGGEVKLRFALAHGFRNIQNVVRKVKGGKCAYDFVELMACPAGCLNGGGQARPAADGGESGKERLARVRALHHESSGEAVVGWPSVDDRVAALYAEGALLSGGPMSAAARAHLHTQYHAREKMQSGLTIKW